MQVPADDIQYLEDIGLTVPDRSQTSGSYLQPNLPGDYSRRIDRNDSGYLTQQHWYVTAANRLDIQKLLKGFQQFFREHSESWIERFDYKEAGPQLLMQAFLQRIIHVYQELMKLI